MSKSKRQVQNEEWDVKLTPIEPPGPQFDLKDSGCRQEFKSGPYEITPKVRVNTT